MGVLMHSQRRFAPPPAGDWYGYSKLSPTFQEGVLYDTAFGSAIARETEQVTVNYPVMITQILWNVPDTATYNIRLCASGTATSGIQDIASATGASGLTTFNPTNGEFMLVPSTNYFFQIYVIDATKKYRYNNDAATYSGTYINMVALWGAASAYKYVAAMQLIGYPVDLKGSMTTVISGYVTR